MKRLLQVDGAVDRPLCFASPTWNHSGGASCQRCLAVSSEAARRRRDVGALLDLARPRVDANFVTLHADRDDFHVSVPLEALRGEGLVVYKLAEAL